MAWKLCRWFVNENIELDPPDPIVTELAAYLAGDDGGVYPDRRYPYDMKATIGTLLRSEFFMTVRIGWRFISILRTIRLGRCGRWGFRVYGLRAGWLGL
jgi:hypothetical protein